MLYLMLCIFISSITVNWPVRTACTTAHHYNSTQHCSTETVLLIFLFLQTNITFRMWWSAGKGGTIDQHWEKWPEKQFCNTWLTMCSSTCVLMHHNEAAVMPYQLWSWFLSQTQLMLIRLQASHPSCQTVHQAEHCSSMLASRQLMLESVQIYIYINVSKNIKRITSYCHMIN